MSNQLLIDADSHITEPRDLWTSRVATKYLEQVPHVAQDGEGRDIWLLNGARIATVGSTAPVSFPGFPPARPKVYEELHVGAADSAERLRYMNEAGIWAQVLYPNVGGFGSQEFLALHDAELQLVCVRAYNDFLREWCSADDRRLIGIISIPFWDVEASVDEIKRCAEWGIRGILFTGEPQRFGFPLLGDHHWDPLYATAQEMGLPIHFHIGGGEDSRDPLTMRQAVYPLAGAEAYTAVNLFMKNGIQCADLITSGALNRFPDLKFVSVESGIGWIPFMLEAADYSFLGAFSPGRRRGAELLPSELFARQVYSTCWFEAVALTHLLDKLPIDNILFETDFPHIACLYENIRETIDNSLAKAPADARDKILWENSAKLYKIADPTSADLELMGRV